MSKLVDNERDLAKILKEKETVFVLIYASWCPHSARFLPIFEKHAEKRTHECARVVINDDESLAEKYRVEYYPSVLFFKKGKVAKRLDVEQGGDLDEDQLKEFFSACAS